MMLESIATPPRNAFLVLPHQAAYQTGGDGTSYRDRCLTRINASAAGARDDWARCPKTVPEVMLNNDWLDNPRLDLADQHEIDMLCAALNCQRTDIYLAVGMVGDSVREIRRC